VIKSLIYNRLGNFAVAAGAATHVSALAPLVTVTTRYFGTLILW